MAISKALKRSNLVRDPKLTVDVFQLLRRVEADAKVRRAIGPTLKDPKVLRSIGLAVIEKIRQRTDDGKSAAGGRLKRPYSKAYQQSLAFQVYGKSKNQVNMKLTGAMMSSMDVVSVSDSGPVIGFVSEQQAEKAGGHISGSGVLPIRDFFGLPDMELRDIIMDVVSDFQDTVKQIDDFDLGSGQQNQEIATLFASTNSASAVEASVVSSSATGVNVAFFDEDFN